MSRTISTTFGGPVSLVFSLAASSEIEYRISGAKNAERNNAEIEMIRNFRDLDINWCTYEFGVSPDRSMTYATKMTMQQVAHDDTKEMECCEDFMILKETIMNEVIAADKESGWIIEGKRVILFPTEITAKERRKIETIMPKNPKI